MSIRAINWAFQQNIPRNKIAKFILVKLADNANDDGICWPSFNYLARHCGVARKNIPRYLKTLEDLNLIKIQRRKRGKMNASNTYALNLPTESEGVSSSRGHGVLNEHLGCPQQATGIIIESSSESKYPVPADAALKTRDREAEKAKSMLRDLLRNFDKRRGAA